MNSTTQPDNYQAPTPLELRAALYEAVQTLERISGGGSTDDGAQYARQQADEILPMLNSLLRGEPCPRTAARLLVDTVNATGGAVCFQNGTIAPAGDEDWVDLGAAYLAACAEIGVQPKVVEQQEEMLVLVLSTSHVTRETLEELEAATERARFVWQYGVIVFVPEADDCEADNEDLRKVFDYCRTHGYEWVRFDSDGPERSDLPTYKWE